MIIKKTLRSSVDVVHNGELRSIKSERTVAWYSGDQQFQECLIF